MTLNKPENPYMAMLFVKDGSNPQQCKDFCMGEFDLDNVGLKIANGVVWKMGQWCVIEENSIRIMDHDAFFEWNGVTKISVVDDD